MTAQISEPITQFTAPDSGRISEQAPVFEALCALTAEFAEMPRPYITISSCSSHFDLQLDHPAHFEMWREALGLLAESVQLKAFSTSVWLAADGEFRGVSFRLSGHEVPLTREQAEASQSVSA